jgi:amino acid transporter
MRIGVASTVWFNCEHPIDENPRESYHLAIMENLFSLAYWFDLTPVRMSSTFEIGFFIVFSLMIVAGLALRIVRKSKTDKYERITLERATNIAFVTGLLGLLWLFLTFEEISIFGARFWFLILAIGLVIAVVRLARYRQITVPQLRMLEQSKAEVNKYLPRRR